MFVKELWDSAREGKNFQSLVEKTLEFSRNKYPTPIHSPHEGFGILLEEFEELKTEIFAKHNKASILVELASVAAVCQRLAEDVMYAPHT